MNYLKKRFSQPTTWFGIAGAAFSLYASGGAVDGAVISQLLACFGLVHVDETPAGGV